MLALQRLDAGLLIHAQRRGAGKRREVEVADALDLLPELRILAMEPVAHSVGPQLLCPLSMRRTSERPMGTPVLSSRAACSAA